jgi:hypothetical protein
LTILKDLNFQNVFFNSTDDSKLNEIVLKEQERLKKR